MFLALIFYVLIGYGVFNILIKIYVKVTTMWCKSKVCLVGKTVLVTGANRGIGYETALECAKRGARVILACRDEVGGAEAVQNIITLTGNPNIVLKSVDLASLESVKKFAADISKTEKRLDILVNNAGALGLGEKMTEDNLQLLMQINYFGPVLLTLILVDLLKESAPSRIVNVSSLAAKYSKLSIENLNKYQGHMLTYADSKLGNILFTQELAKRLKSSHVSVFAVHPGAVATDLFVQHMWPVVRTCFDYLSKKIVKSAEEGAQTSLYAALEPGIEHLTGGFFSECQFQEHYKSAKNPILAQQLWDETIKILNFND